MANDTYSVNSMLIQSIQAESAHIISLLGVEYDLDGLHSDHHSYSFTSHVKCAAFSSVDWSVVNAAFRCQLVELSLFFIFDRHFTVAWSDVTNWLAVESGERLAGKVFWLYRRHWLKLLMRKRKSRASTFLCSWKLQNFTNLSLSPAPSFKEFSWWTESR